jgi:hypothetical protein
MQDKGSYKDSCRADSIVAKASALLYCTTLLVNMRGRYLHYMLRYRQLCHWHCDIYNPKPILISYIMYFLLALYSLALWQILYATI